MISKPLEPVQGHPWLCKTRKNPAVLAIFTWRLVGFTVLTDETVIQSEKGLKLLESPPYSPPGWVDISLH